MRASGEKEDLHGGRGGEREVTEEGEFLSGVIPAKAGIQGERRSLGPWIPAFAGMTNKKETSLRRDLAQVALDQEIELAVFCMRFVFQKAGAHHRR